MEGKLKKKNCFIFPSTPITYKIIPKRAVICANRNDIMFCVEDTKWKEIILHYRNRNSGKTVHCRRVLHTDEWKDLGKILKNWWILRLMFSRSHRTTIYVVILWKKKKQKQGREHQTKLSASKINKTAVLEKKIVASLKNEKCLQVINISRNTLFYRERSLNR